MNDELDRLLKRVPVPERSAGYWEQFPQRVTRHLEDRSRLETAPTRIWWIAGLATACMLIAFLWLRAQHGNDNDYSKLYREVAGMFPNQVRAIVEDEHGVHLMIADKPDVPASPPLLVRVCQAHRCQSIITFSGQRVQFNNETVEVLADGRGKVLVVGERSIIQPTEARAL